MGNTIDFYLSPTRNTAAAKRFLGKALSGLKDWEKPRVINTDKAPTYAAALAELKKEGKCPEETLHRQVKYLNNIIEADHGKLKQLIRPVQRLQDAEDGLRDDQGLRGDARAPQRTGIGLHVSSSAASNTPSRDLRLTTSPARLSNERMPAPSECRSRSTR